MKRNTAIMIELAQQAPASTSTNGRSQAARRTPPLEMVASASGRCTLTATSTPLPRSSALYTCVHPSTHDGALMERSRRGAKAQACVQGRGALRLSKSHVAWQGRQLWLPGTARMCDVCSAPPATRPAHTPAPARLSQWASHPTC